MLHLPFKKLSSWQRYLFSAALLERMLPNVQLFAQAIEQTDDFALIRNQLDLCWQRLIHAKNKFNIGVQLEKLEAVTPDPDKFDFFGVYPALDACMALEALLQGFQDEKHDFCQIISQLSTNSVSFYLQTLLSEQGEQQVSLAQLKADPLMQWELEMQNALFDLVQTLKPSEQGCAQAKQLVLEQGLSNLGIEIS